MFSDVKSYYLGHMSLVGKFFVFFCFFFQAEDGIRDGTVTGVQVCSSDLPGPGKAEASAQSARRCVTSRQPPPQEGAIPMEDAVNASTSGSSGQVVVAGAGYAGLHVDRKSVV